MGSHYRARSRSTSVERLNELIEGLVAVATEMGEQAEDQTDQPIFPDDWEVSQDGRNRAALRIARALEDSRRYRGRLFDPELFGEPTWDMLLDLFISHIEKKAISVSSLAVASGTPHATALRHMARLERAGIVHRIPDANDSRRVNIELSDHAAKAVCEILLRFARRAMLPLGGVQANGPQDWSQVRRN